MGYRHFTKDERSEISILRKKGYSLREIADAIGKHHSSVGRELNRNKVKGSYVSKKAQHKAVVKRSKAKYHGMKIRQYSELEKYVRKKMKIYWTPEQIAGRWNKEKHVASNGEIISISAPSIYKYIYSPYGQILSVFLPSKHFRQKKRKPKKKSMKEIIKNRVFIDERPAVINNRERFGDWEADTLGNRKIDTSVVTGLVERTSRFVIFSKASRLKYAMDEFKNNLNPYRSISHSITFDNGVENTRHLSLGIQTYFCHPYSSWEKGAIENSFLRLRRFISKKTYIDTIPDKQLQTYENFMNNTPRKCLDYDTPLEVLRREISLLNST